VLKTQFCVTRPQYVNVLVPFWRGFSRKQNPVVIAEGFLYSQQFTNSHFHFLVILISGEIPKICFSGPHKWWFEGESAASYRLHAIYRLWRPSYRKSPPAYFARILATQDGYFPKVNQQAFLGNGYSVCSLWGRKSVIKYDLCKLQASEVMNSITHRTQSCRDCHALCWVNRKAHFICLVTSILFTVSDRTYLQFNPLKPELNPICYLLALLGAHHFLHVSRIGVKLLTFRLIMSYLYIWSTHSWCF